MVRKKVQTEPIVKEKNSRRTNQHHQKMSRWWQTQKSHRQDCYLYWMLVVVFTTALRLQKRRFHSLPTVRKQSRSGIVIEKRVVKTMTFSAVFAEAVQFRKNVLMLPQYGQLTKSQQSLLADFEASSITPDRVTMLAFDHRSFCLSAV